MSWLGCDFHYFNYFIYKGRTAHQVQVTTDNERLIRKTFGASIRSALKTTNMPSEVTYNVLVGCNVPPCYIMKKGEPLYNKGLIKNSVPVTLVSTPSKLPTYHQMCATMSWLAVKFLLVIK